MAGVCPDDHLAKERPQRPPPRVSEQAVRDAYVLTMNS